MNVVEPTKKYMQRYEAWLADRPQKIQELGRRFPPYKLYRLLSESGGRNWRVQIYSINEDGTFTVSITKEFNFIGLERNVFGIPPNRLEECDLPEDGEVVGTANVTIDEARQVILGKKRDFDFNERNVELHFFKRSDYPRSVS